MSYRESPVKAIYLPSLWSTEELFWILSATSRSGVKSDTDICVANRIKLQQILLKSAEKSG